MRKTNTRKVQEAQADPRADVVVPASRLEQLRAERAQQKRLAEIKNEFAGSLLQEGA